MHRHIDSHPKCSWNGNDLVGVGRIRPICIGVLAVLLRPSSSIVDLAALQIIESPKQRHVVSQRQDAIQSIISWKGVPPATRLIRCFALEAPSLRNDIRCQSNVGTKSNSDAHCKNEHSGMTKRHLMSAHVRLPSKVHQLLTERLDRCQY